MPARVSLSLLDAEALVLGALEQHARTGASSRSVDQWLLMGDDHRLTLVEIDQALERVANKGEALREGPVEEPRVFAITEAGRVRLRAGRVSS